MILIDIDAFFPDSISLLLHDGGLWGKVEDWLRFDFVFFSPKRRWLGALERGRCPNSIPWSARRGGCENY